MESETQEDTPATKSNNIKEMILSAKTRIKELDKKYQCTENKNTLRHLEIALEWQEKRSERLAKENSV